jgi:hypothetical protein
MTLPESALSVANVGYPILPLVPNGERRLDLGWIPTSELGRIRGQWHRTPDANIGIASDSYLVLGDGLSVKGKGAHIVAPGSVIDGQIFNWSPGHFEGRRPTVAPQWLIERCSAPREGTAS